jgi:hypothetical protein
VIGGVAAGQADRGSASVLAAHTLATLSNWQAPLLSQRLEPADWMQRNLDWRVEVMVPIDNETVKRQLQEQVMLTNLEDTEQSWDMQPDGSWLRHIGADDSPAINAHAFFMTNPSLSGRGSRLEQERLKRLRALREARKAGPRSAES